MYSNKGGVMAKRKKDRTDELLAELVKGKSPEEILGEGGILKQLTKRLVENAVVSTFSAEQSPGKNNRIPTLRALCCNWRAREPEAALSRNEGTV